MPLKTDARITDIIAALGNAEDYVRGIVGSFIGQSFDKERSEIRIGISGRGIYPNYSIIEPCEPEEISLELPGGGTFTMTTDVRKRVVFNGQSHREIDDSVSWGESWSSAAMTFAEVQALLGELEGSNGRAELRRRCAARFQSG
jgi:hypothetical protein